MRACISVNVFSLIFCPSLCLKAGRGIAILTANADKGRYVWDHERFSFAILKLLIKPFYPTYFEFRFVFFLWEFRIAEKFIHKRAINRSSKLSRINCDTH